MMTEQRQYTKLLKYRIGGRDGDEKYLIDRRYGREIGPSPATDCEMELWDALQQSVNSAGKLAEALRDARTRMEDIQAWFNNVERGLPDDDPLSKLRKKYHAPVHTILQNGLTRTESVLRLWEEGK